MNKIKYYYQNASIKNKLLIYLLFIITCSCLFSFYIVHKMDKIIHDYDKHMLNYVYINSLKNKITLNNKYIGEYIKHNDMKLLYSYNESVDDVNVILNNISRTAITDEEKILLRAIRNTYQSYYKSCNQVIKKRINDDSAYYIYMQKAKRIDEYLDLYIGQLMEEIINEGLINNQQIYKEANKVKKLIIIGNIIVFFIGIIISLITAAKFTKPISQLVKQSENMAKGNLDIDPIVITADDELGRLSETFNSMNKSMKRMIKDLKKQSELEMLLEQSKFLALQSQINPHFLFNTLNTISRVITIGDSSNGIDLIDSLAHILRYNLKKAENIATLSEELECINKYMHIQKYRFGDRINCSIEISKEIDIEKVLLPRFTLQPLIENSIIHGLEPKEDGGTVKIVAKTYCNEIIITVIDDGYGMSEERVNELLSKAEKVKGHTTGIGVHNVKTRIELYNKDKNSFSIESKHNEGTRISFQLKGREDSLCIDY